MTADESAPGVVFQRVCDGETLRDIAKSWEIPVGKFVEWFSTQHAELYDAALKVRADELAHQAIAIADEQSEVVKENGETYDPDVPRDKLRVDTRLKLAAKWDRKRYGDDAGVALGSPVTIMIGNLRGAPMTIEAHGTNVTLPAETPETSEAPI